MSILICPLCSTGLVKMERAFVCDNSHSFDISREGYVNFLAAAGRPSRLQGDVQEMLQSRRRFLSAGVYDFLIEQIDAVASSMFHPLAEREAVVLDAGCGEGYYLRRLREQMAARGAAGEGPGWYGFDISKDAIRMAARADAAARYFVQDVYTAIPMRDASVALLLNVFAPRNFKEFARILSNDGLCLVAMPTAEHLQELREYFTMIQVHPQKEERVQDELSDYFDIQDRISLARTVQLSPSQATDAVGMGPNYWHAEPDRPSVALPDENIQVTVSFLLYILRPSAYRRDLH